MKNIIKILAVVAMIISFVSCQNKRKPNYQYMPNMYESVGYEAYGEYEIFPGQQEAMLPAEGSVARGWLPYDFENSPAGYQLAKDTLVNPIKYTKENEEKGKELYDIYCAVCHGAKGDGKGILVQREKILGVPSYDDVGRAITEGSIYHVMYYGINSMGSYASQTSEHERWQIVQYVQKLKAELEGKTPRLDVGGVVEKVTEEEPAVEEEHNSTTEVH
ncbi:c-type cytochrome [Aquimarina algicola]|uniref:Cytochrome c n=1 Tax=Aquimarina algicola TaxID=2589995 RepID=A0A504JGV4_9FLAO|nr:cytochrome c [Aquimarina algicola]TPN86059.1 cytochrome c [Aquimarina algicola]